MLVPAGAQESRPYQKTTFVDGKVLIDIDWTLIYHIDAAAATVEPENVIEHQGKYYRLADYAVEYIELFHQAGLDIAFLSGVVADRNHYVIKKLYEKINTISSTKREVPQIFSMNDLTRVAPEDSGLPFTERYKKDLNKYVSVKDLPNTILIDDDPRFAIKGQRDHFLSIVAFKDILNYSDIEQKLPSNAYYPKNEREYFI